jgi:RNA polymerase sigma-70 factor (ECF subfamily)
VLDQPLAADLEGLFRTRRPALVGAVAAITGNRDLAADAVDEAFARAFARRARVEAMTSPSAWILTVALNHVRRAQRRGVRRRQAEERSAGRAGRPWIEPDDPRHELWAAVAALPPRERTAVALRYLADLTEPQIADVMGIAPGTVGASLTSARRKLAAALAPRTPPGEDDHA